ncbi:MAG: hypothetical protein JWM16_4699, partial [Verrucomicrobiales bacterium]|nr:hypothetical protein [Verrucomicrobiales bacterium]
ADGSEHVVDFGLHPIRDPQGLVIYLYPTGVDITERKRSEAALVQAKAELEQANLNLERMVQKRTAQLREALNELEAYSYSIAHDMRAPLRGMQGFSKLLVEDYSSQLDRTAQEYLRRISNSADRMDRLIQDVLNYSKIVSGALQLVPIDVHPLLEDIIQTYSNLQLSEVKITLHEPLPPVMANLAALTQVFSNLLGNAVKFVAPGVTPRVHVKAEPRGEYVRFWFEDNGIGIEPEAQNRIFQLFQRLNRAELYEGTGLGLAIVRKAVEKMGGKLGLESEFGKGSRFWVELLRSTEAAGS